LIGERIDREIEAAKQLCRELGYPFKGRELKKSQKACKIGVGRRQ